MSFSAMKKSSSLDKLLVQAETETNPKKRSHTLMKGCGNL